MRLETADYGEKTTKIPADVPIIVCDCGNQAWHIFSDIDVGNKNTGLFWKCTRCGREEFPKATRR